MKTIQGEPVVHLIHFYSSPGGIEVLSSRLLSSFRGYTFRVFVIRPHVEGFPDVYEGSGVPVTYGSHSNIYALFRLWRYARRHRNDIFHLFNLGPFYLLSLKLAGARRIVYSIHGTRYWKNAGQRFIRKPLWRFGVRKNVIITSNSGYSRDLFLKEVCPSARVRVIYNPIGSGRFVPPPAKRVPEGLKIVYAGRLDAGKNLEKWVKTATELHAMDGNLKFEIYGSGPMGTTLTASILKLGAEGYISLKGYRSDIENVFRDAGLLLFLSEYESFGNVVVESILCGTPVIASDIPSMKEIFRDYPLFLVSGEEDLCSQISDRLRDYARLADAAVSAGQSFRERFSENGYIKSLDTIYSSLNG